ncbi:MAG: hypothetical protein ACTSO2_18480, partial [Promethearchaeota archaeon]
MYHSRFPIKRQIRTKRPSKKRKKYKKLKYFYISILIFILILLYTSNFLQDYNGNNKILNKNKNMEEEPLSSYSFVAPSQIGQFKEVNYITNVYINGSLACVTDFNDGLEIINITDPTDPQEIGQYNDGGSAWGVYVSGNIAYVADGDDGLEIINITDPTN